ncbi:phospho-acceptor domain-containing protein [Prosthecobacter fusiformis]|uniref:histidine kinase n=1 Tax=Prosthecobacter fusiformis TaxID=48464 RepID=A0A4R7RUH0_9BACT|nr:HAMP domain-containing sensor histidine kinase [Prosthecobacter fusiformis]TDU69311.1 phospho-acceptor domain-containing protein [Prosthecobacter fusiformis]
MLTVHLLFASRSPQAYEAVLEAVSLAFPGAQIGQPANVDELLLNPVSSSKEFLVLIKPEMGEIELALKSTYGDGSARWPVVSLSDAVHSTGLDVIAPEDWHGRLLAQVFRAALQKHELVRENSRLRGDLLTVARRISHDLRTPLSGIFTTGELLKEILAEQSEEDAALTLPLFDSTQAVLRLIERVSHLIRATVDHKAKEPVEMGQIAWAARQGAEKTAMQRGIRMEEVSDWPEVAGVPSWLETIWASLLMNAVTHTGRDRNVKMEWKELPDEYEFSVVDDGPGVAESKVGSLFQPFESLHQTHSAKGLGLSITRRLVELQGGRYGYAPASGGGARFYFTLPKSDSSSSPSA